MTLKTRKVGYFLKVAGVTFTTAVLLALFLSPFFYMIFSSLKTKEQMSQLGSPVWPAGAPTFTYRCMGLSRGRAKF
jgi:ABC-type glycerol-3-phosphate transport system permease component